MARALTLTSKLSRKTTIEAASLAAAQARAVSRRLMRLRSGDSSGGSNNGRSQGGRGAILPTSAAAPAGDGSGASEPPTPTAAVGDPSVGPASPTAAGSQPAPSSDASGTGGFAAFQRWRTRLAASRSARQPGAAQPPSGSGDEQA